MNKFDFVSAFVFIKYAIATVLPRVVFILFSWYFMDSSYSWLAYNIPRQNLPPGRWRGSTRDHKQFCTNRELPGPITLIHENFEHVESFRSLEMEFVRHKTYHLTGFMVHNLQPDVGKALPTCNIKFESLFLLPRINNQQPPRINTSNSLDVHYDGIESAHSPKNHEAVSQPI